MGLPASLSYFLAIPPSAAVASLDDFRISFLNAQRVPPFEGMHVPGIDYLW